MHELLQSIRILRRMGMGDIHPATHRRQLFEEKSHYGHFRPQPFVRREQDHRKNRKQFGKQNAHTAGMDTRGQRS